MTGAGGFIGAFLCRYFTDRGNDVVALSRRETGLPVEGRRYDLRSPVGRELVAGLDVVVHAAYEVAGPANPSAGEINVAGTLALAEATRAAGGRFVFLSSQSASAGARSSYGRHKYDLEARLGDGKTTIVRPGLVVGNGGLIARMLNAMKRGPIPLVDGGRQQVQVVGLADLARAIEICIENDVTGCVSALAAEPVTTREIAASLAGHFGLRLRTLNVPWPAAFGVAWLAERLRLRLPLTTENLWGMRLNGVEPPGLAEFGWRARPWPDLLSTLTIEPAA